MVEYRIVKSVCLKKLQDLVNKLIKDRFYEPSGSLIVLQEKIHFHAQEYTYIQPMVKRY